MEFFFIGNAKVKVNFELYVLIEQHNLSKICFLHNLEKAIRNSNMFSKLKPAFWYWVKFSSTFWDLWSHGSCNFFYYKTVTLTRRIYVNLSRSLSLIT